MECKGYNEAKNEHTLLLSPRAFLEVKMPPKRGEEKLEVLCGSYKFNINIHCT